MLKKLFTQVDIEKLTQNELYLFGRALSYTITHQIKVATKIPLSLIRLIQD